VNKKGSRTVIVKHLIKNFGWWFFFFVSFYSNRCTVTWLGIYWRTHVKRCLIWFGFFSKSSYLYKKSVFLHRFLGQIHPIEMKFFSHILDTIRDEDIFFFVLVKNIRFIRCVEYFGIFIRRTRDIKKPKKIPTQKSVQHV
jgi:hypothetical protein